MGTMMSSEQETNKWQKDPSLTNQATAPVYRS